MKIIIKRTYPKEEYTIGDMYIDGVKFCNTLEDRVRDLEKEPKVYGETAVTYGNYKVQMTYSPKFKRQMPQILNVPMFEGVRIHSANYATEIEGCVALGENKVKGGVINSRKWCDEFERILKGSGGVAELEIIDNKTDIDFGTNKEILILRSAFQTDDYVKKEYSDLLNQLAKRCNATFKIIGEEMPLQQTERHDAVLIATGGVEGLFVKLLDNAMVADSISLIADGRNNSLAASMEILTYLNENGGSGRILHGTNDEIVDSLVMTAVREVTSRCVLDGGMDEEGNAISPNPVNDIEFNRVAIFGEPSDWLIASGVDREFVNNKYNIDFVNIGMERLITRFHLIDDEMVELLAKDYEDTGISFGEANHRDLLNSLKLYLAISQICSEESCTCLTIRCFDIVKKLGATSCLALAMLNDESLDASCEGDLQSLMSMVMARAVTWQPSFMANPSGMSKKDGTTTFAHCTLPMSMCKKYGFRCHFETGLGIAIAGEMPVNQKYTIFKWGGRHLERFFVEEVDSVKKPYSEHLCRTQITLKFYKPDYMLTHPIGNHHIIIKGAVAGKIREAMKKMGVEEML